MWIVSQFSMYTVVIKMTDLMKVPSYSDFDNVCMVLERMDTDLHAILRSKQALEKTHIQYLMHQLLIGMKYLKQCNILHRDLKPANLLVKTDCSLKVCLHMLCFVCLSGPVASHVFCRSVGASLSNCVPLHILSMSSVVYLLFCLCLYGCMYRTHALLINHAL